ncbi:FtsH protease activity modulator HflK [Sandaracinobacteroides saxicola]|uniref:Protein HflK n=1 Tax=Sandaracinobacteroides saxicola TaxID=2759707 RepID=A0A7G5ILK7_9SPHN|nr:FtsH protease activity modulator HflK [Sandaracinobacteroides saxicola]QMW24249.1 FtsH protease activity modulator HflK [Sandaracinobacteroides saxicola]
MPWQNNEDGKKKNPWGANGGSSGGDGPKTPWGGGNKPADFDDFIRRSQEKLRGLGSGSGGGGNRGGGGAPALPNLPWGLIAGGAILAVIAFTSAYQVGAGERAVITRFGQFSSVQGPGFHFKLPAPIDQVEKVKFEDIRTMDIGTGEGDAENLMLTGDQNIIDIAYSVRWRIKNAEQFVFELKEQEQTIQEVAESAMRAEIGRSSLNAAIGPQRAQIAEQVRERMQELLDSYRAGVMVQGVDIKQADPPAAVDEAFKDVSAAQQDAQQFMNQARAYAQQIRARATGEAAAFDAVYTQYRLAPEVTRKRMYLETMESVLSKVDKTVVEAGNVQTYLPLPEVRRRQQANATPPAEPARPGARP